MNKMSTDMNDTSKAVRNRMWWKNKKALIAGVILAVILIVVIIWVIVG